MHVHLLSELPSNGSGCGISKPFQSPIVQLPVNTDWLKKAEERRSEGNLWGSLHRPSGPLLVTCLIAPVEI